MNNFKLFIPDIIFTLLVIVPAFYAYTLTDEGFIQSNLYMYTIIFFSICWFIGSMLGYRKFKSRKNFYDAKRSEEIVNKKVFLKLISVCSNTIVMGVVIFVIYDSYTRGEIGLLNDSFRTDYEGSLPHRLILICLYLISTFNVNRIAFFSLSMVGMLTGWKSLFFYILVSKFHLLSFVDFRRITLKNFTKIFLITTAAFFFIIVAFSVVNSLRTSQSIGFFSIIVVIRYYLIYGFINFSNSLSGHDFGSLLLPANLDEYFVHVTWNVSTGFYKLINNLGLILGGFYLMIIRISGFAGFLGSPFQRYFHFVTMLTAIMLHNTSIITSPSIPTFGCFIFILSSWGKAKARLRSTDFLVGDAMESSHHQELR
jgi:hypothetical protein